MKKKVMIIHGPNINLTGERESSVYGKETFDSINQQILDYAQKLSFECESYQSNIEGELIDKIHQSRNGFDAIILNAGAYTHYSYALRDAISSVKIPCIEVHFSNIFGREEFRSKSVIGPVSIGCISGFGKYSYMLALTAIAQIL